MLASHRRALALARARTGMSLARSGRGVHGNRPATRSTRKEPTVYEGRKIPCSYGDGLGSQGSPRVAGDDVEAREHVEQEDVAGEERGRGGAPRRGQPGLLLAGCCDQKRNNAGVMNMHAGALSTASNYGEEFYSSAWQQKTYMAAVAETQGEGEKAS